MKNKQEILGQYFTKIEIVQKLLDLLFSYKKYAKKIKILEPSFGTGNFIKGLNEKKYLDIDGCEIDKELTKKSCDFFEMSLTKKYDLLVTDGAAQSFGAKYHDKLFFETCPQTSRNSAQRRRCQIINGPASLLPSSPAEVRRSLNPSGDDPCPSVLYFFPPPPSARWP